MATAAASASFTPIELSNLPVLARQVDLPKVSYGFVTDRDYQSTAISVAKYWEGDQPKLQNLFLPILIQSQTAPWWINQLAAALRDILSCMPKELHRIIAEYCPSVLDLSEFPALVEKMKKVFEEKKMTSPVFTSVPATTIVVLRPPAPHFSDPMGTRDQEVNLYARVAADQHSCYVFSQTHVPIGNSATLEVEDADHVSFAKPSKFIWCSPTLLASETDQKLHHVCYTDLLIVPYRKIDSHIDPADVSLLRIATYTLAQDTANPVPVDSSSLHAYVQGREGDMLAIWAGRMIGLKAATEACAREHREAKPDPK